MNPWPIGRLALGAGLLVLVGVASRCSGGGDHDRRAAAFGELERLVFVPAGASDLPDFGGDFKAASKVSLLVDRFEVRRREFESEAQGALTDVQLELPAAADWFTAQAFAESRGMRLPTVSEWMYVASGRLGHAYPWGQNKRRSVANTLELGLLRTAPVGTFESGRGPFGTYDQIGNVWEWAADHEVGIGPVLGAQVSGLRSALGGSYLMRLRPLFPADGAPPVFGISMDPGHRAPDIGLRCVAEARGWLLARAPKLEPESEAEALRLREVGQVWYQTGEGQLTDLLEDLADELRGRRGAGAVHELARGARP